MSETPQPAAEVAPPTARVPVWKNPWVLGFLLGAAAITAMPFLQRKLLRAPPPLAPFPEFKLRIGEGQVLTRAELLGRVWALEVVPGDCDGACVQRVAHFGRALDHLEDLKDRVALVTLVDLPEGSGLPAGLATLGLTARWRVATPLSVDVSNAVSAGLKADTLAAVAARRQVAVVDQRGDLRGLWPDTELGRGNFINAMRLLAKQGPQP